MQQINYECQPAAMYLEQSIMQCSGVADALVTLQVLSQTCNQSRFPCGLRKRIRVNLQTEKMNLQSEGFLEANRADSQSRKMNSESRAYLNVDQRC